jgi:hypothetical protein
MLPSMRTLLDFNGEKWRRDNRCSGITLFVPHSPHPFCGDRLISAELELAFVPAWLTSADLEKGTTHRTLQINVNFYFPRSGDWRSLAGQRFGGEATEEEEDDEPIESWKLAGVESAADLAKLVKPHHQTKIPGPEIEVWSHGDGDIQTHLNEESLRDRVLTFGAWSETDPYELPFTIEGLIITKAAAEARLALLSARIRELFGRPTPQLEEIKRRAKEGQPFRYSSVARFDSVSCPVPLNTAEPIPYAKHLLQRELQLNEFSQCRINGTKRDGTINPEHAVSEQGLLVILNTPWGPRPGLWLPGDEGEP